MPLALSLESLTRYFRRPVSVDSRLRTAARCVVEQIEARTMMSAAPTVMQHPGVVMPLYQTASPTNLANPAAPAGVTATAVGDSGIRITWEVITSDADTLYLDYSTDGLSYVSLATINAAQTQYLVGGLEADTTYYFTMWATNEVGASGNSAVASAKTTGGTTPAPQPRPAPQLPPAPTAPDAPAGLTAKAAGKSGIQLNWSRIDPDADQLYLDYSTDGRTFVSLATVGAADVAYSVSGLEADTTYHFRLWTTNEFSASGYSTIASAKTAGAPASVPTPTPTPQPVTPAKLDAQVVGFQILSAKTGQVLAELKDGDTVDLAKLGTSRINLKAIVKGKAGSVAFAADELQVVENYAPFELAGDHGHWSPKSGSHTITAVPFAKRFAQGDAGQALTVNFTVKNSVVIGDNEAYHIRKRVWSLK